VEYDNDLIWHQWNIAAKKRILMDTIEVTAVPMAAYYIEQNMTNKGSLVSSLGSTVASTQANESSFHDNSVVRMKTSVVPPSNMGSDPSTVNLEDHEDINGLDFDLFEGFEEDENMDHMGWDGEMTTGPISDAVSKPNIPHLTPKKWKDLHTEQKEKV
jgi:hypothetical protein